MSFASFGELIVNTSNIEALSWTESVLFPGALAYATFIITWVSIKIATSIGIVPLLIVNQIPVLAAHLIVALCR